MLWGCSRSEYEYRIRTAQSATQSFTVLHSFGQRLADHQYREARQFTCKTGSRSRRRRAVLEHAVVRGVFELVVHGRKDDLLALLPSRQRFLSDTQYYSIVDLASISGVLRPPFVLYFCSCCD